jgi:DUF1009 family protein
MAPDSAAGRVVIIAGNGRIPIYVAEELQKAGRAPFIIAVEGEADVAVTRFDHAFIGKAQIGELVSLLKKVDPSDVTMVGGVRGRPPLHQVRPGWTMMRLAGKILRILKSGDDVLLRAVIETIEDEGYRVRGVHELVPELLADLGHIAGPKPTSADHEALATASRGAMALGRLDAGQACVAIGRRVVALEGAEGTDDMLKRVADLRVAGRLPKGRGGVLVKLAKPGQELRADLPSIGALTVENAFKAGLRGIGIHGEHALIADRKQTIEIARARKLFVIGINPDEFGADA